MTAPDPIPLRFRMDDRFVFTGSELTELFFDMAYIAVDLTEDVLRDLDSRFGDSPYGEQYAICSEMDAGTLLKKVCVYESGIDD